jgi:predicted TPR repeat methyltransferase
MSAFDLSDRGSPPGSPVVPRPSSPKGNNQEIIDQADRSFKAGRFSDAERLLKSILSHCPRHIRVFDRLGGLLAHVGRYAEAETHIRQAIRLGVRSPKIFYNLGTVLKHLRRPLEALDALDKALAIDVADAEFWNTRGTVLNDLGRHEEAVAAFDAAIRPRADFPGAFYNKAKSLQLLGRFAEASSALDHALLLRPESAETWVARQALLRMPHALRRSRRPFEPSLGEMWAACGNVLYHYRRLINAREALAAYERALAINPALAEAWLGRGQVLGVLASHEQALAAFDKALAIEPDLAEAWLGRAQVLHETNRAEEAISAYRRARELGGDAEFIHCALASLGAEAPPAAAPRGLVVDLYDRYADQYDQHVTSTLKYRTPELLGDLIARSVPAAAQDIVDLGCGTGLLGLRLQARARTLTGVDISANMLARAHRRGVYSALICGELVEFLRTRPGEFDLAAAADVFVYIGDLSEVFRAVREKLRPQGTFCFSVEAGGDADFKLRANLRYAHSAPYLRRLAEQHEFRVEAIETHILRRDSGVDVAGHLAMLRRG